MAGSVTTLEQTYSYDAVGNLTQVVDATEGVTLTYNYDTGHPHAAALLEDDDEAAQSSYGYDANGNMTSRVITGTSGTDTFSLAYDVENRLVAVAENQSVTTTMVYDGDGVRVKKTVDDGSTVTTTYYVGNWYEKTGTEVTKYYYHGGRLVALRRTGYGDGNDGLFFMHADHLGSTMITTDHPTVGSKVAEQRFCPWGHATRYTSGTQRFISPPQQPLPDRRFPRPAAAACLQNCRTSPRGADSVRGASPGPGQG